jgi:putative restriction endonuclease
MEEPVFSHNFAYPEGSYFPSRVALSRAGLHRPLIAGIAGSGRGGARSVVISGAYEDDEDFGSIIIYTGHGGRDPETGRQIAHQTLTRGNLALAYSALHGLPVRLIRSAGHPSPHAPEVGYCYDGLHIVEDYWQAAGKSGFYVWRYRLCKMVHDPEPNAALTGTAADAISRIGGARRGRGDGPQRLKWQHLHYHRERA